MADGSPRPIKGAKELLRRYGEGDRYFVDADLHRANLCGADLRRANLRDANLRRANLGGANLRGADLHGANLSEADLSEADLRGANLHDTNLGAADLRGADLRRANLHSSAFPEAYLPGADLRGTVLAYAYFGSADLSGADLSGAFLIGADVGGPNLSGANLHGANLSEADLRGANLHDTNLGEADLSHANLSGASLTGANFGRAHLLHSVLADIDLSPLCDASPPVEHHGPSVVDCKAIMRSLRSPNLRAFLQSTGMPEVFIEFDLSCAESLDGSIIKRMLQSTFISYGNPDSLFARKLRDALHRNGVQTWFFEDDAMPGDKLHRMMRTKINEHDRVILVCSRASLDRKGVLNEIEETLAREARDGGAAYLIPIRLDGYVFSGWTPPNPDTAQSVRDRVVANFEGADSDPAKFDAGLLKLIAALKK